MDRVGKFARKTAETDIKVSINIDGKGISNIKTGIGFFDHMLTLFSKHGFFDLNIEAVGDLHVDFHHTVEDVGIVMGQAVKKALGQKGAIKRYGSVTLPMDEVLSMVSVDLSGRPFFVFNVELEIPKIGEFDTELIEEFFRALSYNIGMNLHINILYGSNTHHIIESIFKASARALSDALVIDSRISGVMSTKGSLSNNDQ